MVEGVARSRREDNMNNFTSNPKGTPRQRARGKQTRGCEPSSLKLSLLFPILSVTDGDTIRTYTYHADGQLATDSYSGDGRALSPRAPQTETFFSSGESFRSPFPVPHSPFFTGKPMVPVAMGGGTYARALHGRGVAFGPVFSDSRPCNLHMPDENLSVEEFMLHAEICYRAMCRLAVLDNRNE